MRESGKRCEIITIDFEVKLLNAFYDPAETSRHNNRSDKMISLEVFKN